MLNRVLETIEAHSLIQPREKIIVAVSGGGDSTCLAHILWRLRRKLKCKLVFAHLDHTLRGAAIREDAFFVQRFSQKLNIPFLLGSLAKPPANENAARKARYLFLEKVRQDQNAHKIATAHHQDDQVETILLHWLRGTGFTGLTGMNYRRQNVIRPLLDCSRQKILEYLEQNQLKFCQDSTNQETKFLRNRVRYELLPLLEAKYNPKMRKNLLRLACLARHTNTYLAHQARQFLKQNPRFINLYTWRKLPTILQTEVVRQACFAQAGHLSDLYAGHIMEISKMLKTPHGNKKIDLPNGLRIFKKNGRIWLNKKAI